MLQEHHPEVDIPSAADDTRAPSLESAEGPVDDIPDDKTTQSTGSLPEQPRKDYLLREFQMKPPLLIQH